MYRVQDKFPLSILRFNRRSIDDHVIVNMDDVKVLRPFKTIDEVEEILFERAMNQSESIKSSIKPTHLYYNISLAMTLVKENSTRGYGNVLYYHPIHQNLIDIIKPELEDLSFVPSSNCRHSVMLVSYIGKEEHDAPVVISSIIKYMYICTVTDDFDVGFQDYNIVINLST